MDATTNSFKERWQPLPHVAPVGLKNSMLFYSRLFFDLWVYSVYADVRKYLNSINSNVLEVGCGLKPYRHLVPEGVKYCGIDWDGAYNSFNYRSDDTIYYEGVTFPAPDGSFDNIFHTEVLEHIYELDHFLSECHRVLSGNGKMFFTMPFAARYHYIPYDYWRLTPSSIEKLLTYAGFANITICPKGGDTVVIIAKINVLILRILMRPIHNTGLRVIYRISGAIFFSTPFILLALIGHLLLFLHLGSTNDPLGYSVYCEKNTTKKNRVN